MAAITQALAERMLKGQHLIAAKGGSIAEMKALRDRCLEAGIPALVGTLPSCGCGKGCGGGCGKGCGTGWGSKTNLLVQEASIPALGRLLHGEWHAHLEREGLAPVSLDMSSDEPPCPACGTAAPLVRGACSDCGLRLE